MQLTDILTLNRVLVPAKAADKRALIEEMIDALVADGAILDRQKVLDAVMERERTRTTGIGGGFAIPHGRTSGVKSLAMTFARPQTPVDFDSIDRQPVSLAILLVSPGDQTGPHIQALARVARMMGEDSLRKKILSAATAGEVFELIRQYESQPT
jgi:fructose-specific phosphotransferase system IIA component